MFRRCGKVLICACAVLLLWSGCAARVWNEDLKHAVSPCKGHTQEDMVICQGLVWLFEHPVDIKKDGFLELGEELNLFYRLYLFADDPIEKRFFKDYVTSRVDYLLNEHQLKVDFAGEITGYLNFAKIMKRMGIDRPKLWNFIDQEIIDNPMTYPPNITYTVLNAALVEDIGRVPKMPFENLVSQGVVARFARNPELVPIGKAYASADDVMNYYYDITHEIFAVSNFGDRDPKQFLLDDEIQFLKTTISQGVSAYIEMGQLDILAELIVCAKMLNYTEFDGFQKGIQFILDFQKEDGSFGLIERMAFLGRPNLYRHGVLVALWALIEKPAPAHSS
ncbi:hypothetical protein JXL19_08875 [bacterium]|nr:hypothetical protein [bacterium]